MVVRGHPSLSLTRQCRLLSIGRSSLYDRPKGESAETLALMRRIDALFLKYPFYGARQMVRHLRREGVRIGRRRAARLMRLLGLQAVYRAPRTSAPHLGHRVYPYLLRGLAIERPNHVWCADITYIPVRRGFLYLVAIMDWASRCVLAWRLSNTLDAGFCVEALDEALARHGTPQIFNTDQGSQFTGFAFTARLREAGIRISMDGRGRCMDNIFIERLWRSLKYEAVYLHEIADGFAARRVIGQWIGFYNTERPHSALGGRTPAEAYRGDTPVDMMDKPLRALTTYPQAQQQQQKDRSKRILAAQTSTGIHLENAVSLSDKPTPPHGIDGLSAAGIFHARGGQAWLFSRDELSSNWDPATDSRLTDWECAQHLARALESAAGGIEAVASLYARMGPERSGNARLLAYRLYDICERKGRAAEAQVWNMLAQEWPAIEAAAADIEPQAAAEPLLL